VRISLRWKITLAFIVMIVVTSTLVSLLLHQMVGRAFSNYIRRRSFEQAERLLPTFKSYYQVHGSWADFRRPDKLKLDRNVPLQRTLPWLLNRAPLILLDADNNPVWSNRVPLPKVPPADDRFKDNTFPIVVQGKKVGTLIVLLPDIRAAGSVELFFLRSLNRSLELSAAIALAIALLLSVFLSRQIVKPLQTLARAAQDVTEGNLSRRVQISVQDEVGDLGAAFNQMAATLEREEQLREDLMANIAHELRTPLSVIRGSLEAFLDGVYDLTDENIASVYQETILLERLVDDLRELSLAEAGKLRLEVQQFAPEALVSETANFFQAAAQTKKIDLVTHSEPELPTVRGDFQRLKQVLHNLLSNALRYTPAGGRIEISVRRLWGTPDQIAISVHDSGPGIPGQDLPHLFDRFYRGDTSRARSTGGSGLGLTIAKEIVEAHGGRIWAESRPGEGSTFTVTLPVPQPE